MASAGHAEGSCLHVVVIVGFAAEAWEMGKKQTHADIQAYICNCAVREHCG